MSTLNADLAFLSTARSPSSKVPSRAALWTGRALSTLVVLFLGFDAVMKLLRVGPVLQASAELGFPAHTIFGIGLVLAFCVVAYVIPRTSLLGAVLLTGYLGGAIATHVRLDHPLWTHTLFPVYVAALAWGGLLLRDRRVRGILDACLRR